MKCPKCNQDFESIFEVEALADEIMKEFGFNDNYSKGGSTGAYWELALKGARFILRGFKRRNK